MCSSCARVSLMSVSLPNPTGSYLSSNTPVRWTVVQGCGLLANLGLVYLFVDGMGLDKLLGQACATAIVTVITFTVNRAWTFRMHPSATPAGQSANSGEG